MTVSIYRNSPTSLEVFSTTTPAPRPPPPPLTREDSRKLPEILSERSSSNASIKIPSISTINGHNNHDAHSPVMLPGLAALASIAAEQIE